MDYKRIWLTGPAHLVFKGGINVELLKGAYIFKGLEPEELDFLNKPGTRSEIWNKWSTAPYSKHVIKSIF